MIEISAAEPSRDHPALVKSRLARLRADAARQRAQDAVRRARQARAAAVDASRAVSSDGSRTERNDIPAASNGARGGDEHPARTPSDRPAGPVSSRRNQAGPAPTH